MISSEPDPNGELVPIEYYFRYIPYLTTFRQSFIPQPPQDTKPFICKQEFANPLCQDVKNYLDIDNDSPDPPMENANKYLEELWRKKPDLAKRYFRDQFENYPIKMEEVKSKGLKSTYYDDYCRTGTAADYQMRVKKRAHLPEDMKLPLTTNSDVYRYPRTIYENAYEKRPTFKYKNNLDRNLKEREILKVKTPLTDYQRKIGSLGEFAVENNLHGKLVYPTAEECLKIRLEQQRGRLLK